MTHSPRRPTGPDRPATAGSRIGSAFLALALATLAGPALLCGQDDPLPKAETILDKYVEATGGKAAYAKLRNRVTHGTIEIVSQKLKMKMTTFAARPDKSYVRIESDTEGRYEQGSDGTVVWEISTRTGASIKGGDERAQILREGTFDADVEWRKLFKKAECEGLETVDGKPCYKLALTPRDGVPETRYYDKETNLLTRSTLELRLPAGTIRFDLYLSDYKKVDGVHLAHTIRQVIAGGQEYRFVVERMEHNVKLPDDCFALPEEVKKLVAQKKGKTESGPTP